jgi:hypothetical protein
MLNTIGSFCYLQLLDFLTTIAFLVQGVQEGNPVVRWALRSSHSPLTGLVAVKLIALGLGIYCWQRGKHKLLGSINFLFALVVTWNVCAIILHATGHRLS